MINLGKYIVYLCGPIQDCSDDEAKDWRKKATFLWPGQVLDPMRRDFRSADPATFAQLVRGDKEDIQQSHALLVYYTGDKPSVGTSMEILYAYSRGKLVVIVDVNGKAEVNPWLQCHSHEIVATIADAVTYLCNFYRNY